MARQRVPSIPLTPFEAFTQETHYLLRQLLSEPMKAFQARQNEMIARHGTSGMLSPFSTGSLGVTLDWRQAGPHHVPRRNFFRLNVPSSVATSAVQASITDIIERTASKHGVEFSTARTVRGGSNLIIEAHLGLRPAVQDDASLDDDDAVEYHPVPSAPGMR